MNATTTTTTLIPLSQLVISPANVRKVTPTNLDALAASIKAMDILQNLVVIPSENDCYEVVAGGRRLAALNLLVDQGHIDTTKLVPCLVRTQAEATAVSLAENEQREQMNGADRFDAYSKLQSEGYTIEQIADAFGCTTRTVERYLALHAAAPELLNEMREGTITIEQLTALCSSPDHDKQLRVWDQAWGEKEPRNLRRAVLDEEIDVTNDRRIAFIGGVDAFTAAGGIVRTDLFSEAGTGFTTDNELLDKLVSERLEAAAETLRGEGWAWVEVMGEFDWSSFNRFGRVPATSCDLTKEQKAAVKVRKTEFALLEKEQQEIWNCEEETDEQGDRLEWISDRLDELKAESNAIEANAVVYADGVKSAAGAIASFHNGALRMDRGLVRAEDRAALAKTKTTVTGGSVKVKDNNAMSDALTRSLLCHRNIAVQAETAKNVRVAKVLMGCWVVGEINKRFDYDGDRAPTNLSLSPYGVRAPAGSQGEDVAERLEAFHAAGKALVAGIKGKGAAVWDAVTALDDAMLDQLLAYGVALSVSVDESHGGFTGKLLGALDFDMSAHFDATPANYLGRVSKEQVLKALTQAGKENDKAALLTMKKGALAEEAAKRLKGTGWVPALIRTPAAKKPATTKVAQSHKTVKKAAAPVKGKAKAKATTKATRARKA